MTGELAALCAALVWALASLIFARLGRQNLSPLAMNLVKCAVALALMSVTLKWQSDMWLPTTTSTQNMVLLAVSGVVGLTIGDTAYFHALKRIGAQRTLLLATLGPPTTALLAWPTLGEALTWTKVLGMALTLGGVLWVISERAPRKADAEDSTSEEQSTSRSTLMWGVGFALIAVFCQASGNVLTKMGNEPGLSPLGLGMLRLIAGVAGLVVVVSISGRLKDVGAALSRPKQASLLLLATFLGTYLGIWLLMTGIQRTEVGVAATLSATSPLFLLILSPFVSSERVTYRAILGTCVAICGVAILFGVWPDVF